MNYENCHQKLMDYLFAELNESDKNEMDKHLNECPDCKKELQELQATVQIMDKWEEIKPQKEMVFVHPQAGFLQKLSGFFRRESQLSGIVKWAGRFALVSIVAVILLVRTDVRYDKGQFSLTFGQEQAADDASLSPANLAAFKQLQEQNLYLMQQMIAASENRQKELFLTGINELSHQIDQKRYVDLQYMGENLQKIQRTNEYNFTRTNSILQGLIKVAQADSPQNK